MPSNVLVSSYLQLNPKFSFLKFKNQNTGQGGPSNGTRSASFGVSFDVLFLSAEFQTEPPVIYCLIRLIQAWVYYCFSVVCLQIELSDKRFCLDGNFVRIPHGAIETKTIGMTRPTFPFQWANTVFNDSLEFGCFGEWPVWFTFEITFNLDLNLEISDTICSSLNLKLSSRFQDL